jgi:hypothetical protein
MRVYIPVVFLLAGLSSCCTEKFDAKVAPLNSNAYYTCNQSLKLDSVSASVRLTGSWKAKKVYNIWTGETQALATTETINFAVDSTYTVTENGSVKLNGTWHLEPAGDAQWRLVSNPYCAMSAPLLFCENEIVTYTSPGDGPDVLYQKAQ